MSSCIVRNMFILLLLFSVAECYQPTLSNKIGQSVVNMSTLPLFDDTPYPDRGVIPILNKKIFKGTRVSIREHPYVASIRRKVAHYLVGTILTKNLLITVAHPLIKVPITELSVVVGENYADRGPMLFTVIVLVIHENFDRYTMSNDIALLRTYENIVFKGSAKSIALLSLDKNALTKTPPSYEGRLGFVTGWGRCDRTGRELCLPRSSRYTDGESFDPMLRTVTFHLKKSNPYCDVYSYKDVPLSPGMLCLGMARKEEFMGQCMAVPGAPLVVGARLIGILSWGFGCGHRTDLPLVYTSIRYYLPWLVHNSQVMHKISNEQLLKLFKAHRASILEEWFRLTRIVPPDLYYETSLVMRPLKVDKELATLSGTVYDIRNFVYNGIHNDYKLKLYKKLAAKYSYNSKIHNETVQWYTNMISKLYPFLKTHNYSTYDDGDTTVAGNNQLPDNEYNYAGI
ncbi:trypsin delta-like [Anticarsia gemmatalis]|uniref:trypsin delta-like n=1 Tax=Anticarsia gemmatalis TaxID=129554 RepID=UPI003F7654BD